MFFSLKIMLTLCILPLREYDHRPAAYFFLSSSFSLLCFSRSSKSHSIFALTYTRTVFYAFHELIAIRHSDSLWLSESRKQNKNCLRSFNFCNIGVFKIAIYSHWKTEKKQCVSNRWDLTKLVIACLQIYIMQCMQSIKTWVKLDGWLENGVHSIHFHFDLP